ncbi:hypothetical protein GJ496_012049 [Pomphorhynchus laevis]|nr:hypothetical protein GJ496_012049 [Pomphorhynchus laevis]
MRRSLLKLSVSVLTVLLSIADNSEILTIILVNWIFHNRGIDDCTHQLWICCHFQGYLDMVFSAISSWTVIFVSVDRWFCVNRPMRKVSLFNKRNVSNIVIVYIILAFIIFAWFPIMTKYNRTEIKTDGRTPNYVMQCQLRSRIVYKILGVIDVFIIYIIPLIVLIILNAMTISKLSSKSQTMREHKTIAKVTPGHYLLTTVTKQNSTFRRKFSKTANAEFIANVMLTSVAISYVICLIPFQVNWCFNQIVELTGKDLRYRDSVTTRHRITLTIKNLNYMSNFFLYSATSSLFRREIKLFIISEFKSKTQTV